MPTITFRVPGLPDDGGRLSWTPIPVDHVRGRSLAGYLAEDLFLEPAQVHHVIVAGRVIRPEDMVTVPVPETAWQRRWRKIRRGPAPTVDVSAFDAYVPSRGAEIVVIPSVDGKNASVILGAVGIVVGIALAAYLGPASLTFVGALQAGMTGYAVGSTIGALVTPKPRVLKESDGPSSYTFGGTHNDDRAGVPKPILVGERIVGGKRIGMVRRRPGVVPVRVDSSSYSSSSPTVGSEELFLLLLIAAHQCEGPVGTVDPLLPAHSATNRPDVRINGSHYSNFTGTRVDWRTGLPGQSVIRGFDVAANTYDLAVELTVSNYTYTTVDEVDAFEVLLELPALFHTDDEKGIQQNTTRYILEYRKVGDVPWLNADYDGQRVLKAHVAARRLETRRVEILPTGEDLPRGQYEIRLRWVSADETDPAKDAWKIFLTGVTEEIQESRNYEGESLLSIAGLATDQLNGPVPTVTSVWRGYIPSKYVSGVGWSAPDWGVGDFAPAGKNPFWLSLALMRDARIGAGNEVTDDEIDLDSFAAAAPNADASEEVEPVDGDPYDEPRHQFSAYLDQDQEFIDLIPQILSTARGVLIPTGNKYRVNVDAPGTISQVFGMGSMRVTGEPPNLEPTFQLQFKSERHEVNTFEGTFDDAVADWETDSHVECIDNRNPDDGGGSFVSEDDLAALELPLLRRKVQFWGVDRRTQVSRELRFMLRQAYALREYGSFGAYTEALLAEVYDLIGISNDTPQWSYSGRCFENAHDPAGPEALSTVMFDRSVPWDDSTPYQVMVRFREPGVDGHELIETRDVDDVEPSGIQGEYFGVGVSTPFTRAPQEGDEWFYGPADLVARPVRIIDIDRDADDERSITFAEYNESVYDTSGPIVIPQYSLLPDFAAPPGAIPELKATAEIVRLDDGRRITNILLQWTRPNPTRTSGPYKGARLEYSFDDEHWNPLISVDGTEHRWIDAPHGLHIWFRAIPYSLAGRYNLEGAAYDDLTPEGYGETAPIITGLTGGYADGAFWLSWDALGPEYEYEVRQTSNPANWASDAIGYLWRGKTLRFLDESPDARSITYYVRARDPFGNYSLAAVSFAVADAAPAAPTITTITRFKDGFKIRVTPPGSTPDIVAIHLHATQSSGFTPSAANRVSMPVGPSGGEFLFKTSTTGTWYFKATCEDWLSVRMNDWVYSSQDDDDIIVVAPVDPTGVGLTFTETDGKEVERVNGVVQTRAKSRADIEWSHTDAVNPANSLIGWQIVIYDTVDGIDKPLKDSGVIADPGLRDFFFPGVYEYSSSTAIAAVKAVYVDGVTSDYVTSTGETIPQATNPHIRDSDDRYVPLYGDSFDAATLPIGFSVIGATYALNAPPGELKVIRNAPTNYVAWDFEDWAVEYIDTLLEGTVNAILGLKIDTPAQLTGPVYLRGNGGDGVTIEVELPIVNDGEFHAYCVPWGSITIGDITYTPRISIDFSSSGLPTGGTGIWRVRDMALGRQGVDSSWDGHVDRGEQARRNFARDPDGDGMHEISPIRIGDADGNYHLIEENGSFFLRNESGDLVTETAYKLGRQGRIARYTHGAQILFADDTDSNWGIGIKIPTPHSFNKSRFVIQDVGNDLMPSSAFTAGVAVRRWFEACNLIHGGTPNFKVAGAFLLGGTMRRHHVEGPWSPTQQSKSALLLNTTDSNTTDATNDAWYYVQDDTRIEGGSLPNDNTAPYDIYYRIVIWLEITMPDVKRANGSRYYADFDFTTRVGNATLAASQMDISATDLLTVGPYRARLLSDGLTHQVPIVIGRGAVGVMQRNLQNIKMDWHALAWETGGAGTPTVQIGAIDWSYIEQATDVSPVTASDVGFVYLEEHGG